MTDLTGYAYSPDSTERREWFKNCKADVKQSICATLENCGRSLFMTELDLLSVASELTGCTADELMSQALSLAAQKAITLQVGGAVCGTAPGAADSRILEAIHELRKKVTNGQYKPRADTLPLSIVAGVAMTNVTTVRSCLKRHPEWVALTNVVGVGSSAKSDEPNSASVTPYSVPQTEWTDHAVPSWVSLA